MALQPVHNSSSLLLCLSSGCSAPAWDTFFRINLLRCGSSMGCSPSGIPGPAWVLHGLQFLQEIPTCSGVGTSMGYSVHSCSGVVLTKSCRGTAALVPEAPPSPSYSLTLVFTGSFLMFPPPPPYSSLLSGILLFLKYVTTEASPAWLMVSAVFVMGPLWSELGPAASS